MHATTPRQQAFAPPLRRIALVVLLGLGGCATDPAPFTPTPIDAIPEGPGLLTGAQGAWEFKLPGDGQDVR